MRRCKAGGAPDDTGGWEERREDYALRYVPAGYRRWGPASLTAVMLGVATAMFFLAWGGQLATSYGTVNTFIDMVFGTVFIGGLAFLLARISSATGLDSDLITRGSGFGFMASPRRSPRRGTRAYRAGARTRRGQRT